MPVQGSGALTREGLREELVALNAASACHIREAIWVATAGDDTLGNAAKDVVDAMLIAADVHTNQRVEASAGCDAGSFMPFSD